MKYELKDVELTGEYRTPKEGELMLVVIGVHEATGDESARYYIVRPKATPETESRPEPKFKVGDRVIEQHSIGIVEAVVWNKIEGCWMYVGKSYSGIQWAVKEEALSFAYESKPAPKMVGNWSFKPTRKITTMWIKGAWYIRQNGVIFRAECDVNSDSPARELELIEQPREEFEFPNEVVLERCSGMDGSAKAINHEGKFDAGGHIAFYRVKDGQLPKVQE